VAYVTTQQLYDKHDRPGVSVHPRDNCCGTAR
jgi:hypothetical protein